MNQELEVVYNDSTGQNVKITPQMVRQYLQHGDGRITDQEMMMFLSLCKYQRLNPFVRDAYLIKFGNQPATIVAGKDAFTKRARRLGLSWKAGVIYMGPNQELRRSLGVIPTGAELLGGWAEVYTREGVLLSSLEVSFEEFVGRKRDGTINRQWAEKPGVMIRKCALVGALREAAPDDYAQLYDEVERSDAIQEPVAAAVFADTPSSRSAQPAPSLGKPQVLEAEHATEDTTHGPHFPENHGTPAPRQGIECPDHMYRGPAPCPGCQLEAQAEAQGQEGGQQGQAETAGQDQDRSRVPFRSRRTKVMVDGEEIQTAGISAESLAELRRFQDVGDEWKAGKTIESFLQLLAERDESFRHLELEYLREEEAQDLLGQLNVQRKHYAEQAVQAGAAQPNNLSLAERLMEARRRREQGLPVEE